MAIEALYLHLPFCRSRCAYCDFDTRAYAPAALDKASAAYVDRLLARLDSFARRGALANVRTAYLGGGTPSTLGARLPEVVRAVRSACGSGLEELTCEANPESFTEELARGLERAGATRISLGVQSLDDAELAAVGRIHTADQALAAIERSRRHGFSTSCDLICGLPGQTAESWARTLDRAIGAGVDHVSIYPLTVEEGTPLARAIDAGELNPPDDDFEADCMEVARSALTTAGLAPYEVASYARPGTACQHNIAYWTGESYLGLGRSGASMLAAGEYRGLADLFGAAPGDAAGPSDSDPVAPAARVRIVQRDDAATAFELERLSAREAAAEDLMLACRMTRGIPVDLLERSREVIPAQELDSACVHAVELGLARWTDGHGHPLCGDKVAKADDPAPPSGAAFLAPTTAGWLEGNKLFGLFWGLA